MSKEEELQRFKVELEKQIEKENESNIKYCRLNIERLEKEIAAQQGVQRTCANCGASDWVTAGFSVSNEYCKNCGASR